MSHKKAKGRVIPALFCFSAQIGDLLRGFLYGEF
jgi:hypothetical protein